MDDYVIDVDHVTKIYKLYDKPIDRVKEALGFNKKKRYKDHYAINDLSFAIKKGETVGIIGVNGSGKSTILKIITGVLSPTIGKVNVKGKVSALLELGTGFNSEYTGINNIYLNGTMLGYSKEEMDRKLDTIINFADIGDFIYQPVKTYSSGMFVRLAFAVAINVDPEILIVDEALSVGDVFFQAKCFRKFEEFKKSGKTILFVSHDLSSIKKYCDRAILLHHGEKVKEGNTKEIVDLYKKILVNQYEDTEEDTDYELPADSGLNSEIAKDVEKISDNDGVHIEWKQYLSTNPQIIEYGNRKIEIIDYCVVDNHGSITMNIEKNTKFSIKMKVKINDTISNPIFAYTIKDRLGNEITGTNTLYEGVQTGNLSIGSIIEIEFEQMMSLHGGDYLLSLGCTGYEEMDFVVYHRLYDVINILVLSDKNSVGYYDMNSKISICRSKN
jgi:teichoic acid transport system ATP-binding protein